MDMLFGAAVIGGVVLVMWLWVIPWLAKSPKKRR